MKITLPENDYFADSIGELHNYFKALRKQAREYFLSCKLENSEQTQQPKPTVFRKVEPMVVFMGRYRIQGYSDASSYMKITATASLYGFEVEGEYSIDNPPKTIVFTAKRVSVALGYQFDPDTVGTEIAIGVNRHIQTGGIVHYRGLVWLPYEFGYGNEKMSSKMGYVPVPFPFNENREPGSPVAKSLTLIELLMLEEIPPTFNNLKCLSDLDAMLTPEVRGLKNPIDWNAIAIAASQFHLSNKNMDTSFWYNYFGNSKPETTSKKKVVKKPGDRVIIMKRSSGTGTAFNTSDALR